jgi:hypothetical protein
MKNLSNVILLKYDEKGETKSGIIKIRFNYDVEDETLNYAGIDYSDNNIQDYIK